MLYNNKNRYLPARWGLQLQKVLEKIPASAGFPVLKGRRWWLVIVAGATTATIAAIDDSPTLAPSLYGSNPNRPIELIRRPDFEGRIHQYKHYPPWARTTQGRIAPTNAKDPASQSDYWSEIKIRRGDTLIHVLKRHGVNADDIRKIASLESRALRYLQPGKILTLHTVGDRLLELTYKQDLARFIHVHRVDKGYRIDNKKKALEERIRYVTGGINSSLFVDGQHAGLSDALILQLMEIFAWDIDFALDIRRGDSFTVAYVEKYRLGVKVADGPILAAEFRNQGQIYRAVAHHDADDRLRYYTPQGRSVQRAFLRSPVKYSRISSRFSRKRYHPVLKRWRAHKGVDYSAPTGTPVRTTAKGRIAFIGRKGGYGRTVIVRHGDSYSTLYAHLSRFGRKLHNNSVVQQGDIIGYVGQSGLATGPHLHYEFRVNNRHRNPLTFNFPASRPISKQHRDLFLSQAKTWLDRLQQVAPAQTLALANNL